MPIEEDIRRLQQEQARMQHQIDSLLVFAKDSTLQTKTLANYAMWLTLALRQSDSPVNAILINAARALDRHLQAHDLNNRYWDLLLADFRSHRPEASTPAKKPAQGPTLVTPEWLAAHFGNATSPHEPDPPEPAPDDPPPDEPDPPRSRP